MELANQKSSIPLGPMSGALGRYDPNFGLIKRFSAFFYFLTIHGQ